MVSAASGEEAVRFGSVQFGVVKQMKPDCGFRLSVFEGEIVHSVTNVALQ